MLGTGSELACACFMRQEFSILSVVGVDFFSIDHNDNFLGVLNIFSQKNSSRDKNELIKDDN
jgi:hypothetical protein